MTVSWYGICGARSLPQSKNGLITTFFGMCGALSAVLRFLRAAELVVEQRLVPAEVALDRLAVRVEQQLGAVAAQPARRDRRGRARGSRSAGPGAMPGR